MENTKKVVTPEASAGARALRLVNSPAQQAAAKENGKKGGRPAGQPLSDEHKAKLRDAALRRAEAKKAAQDPQETTDALQAGA